VTWLPQSLGLRLALAGTVAAVTISGLSLWVRARDVTQRLARHAGVSGPVQPPARPWLVACGGRVLLASRLAALPPATAPVLQVFADGSVALRRPAALPRAPAGQQAPGDAGILLPTAFLAELGPAARAALLDLIGGLVAERPVTAARVVPIDVEPASPGLGPLLQWVP
jgi:hypothetical protein